MLNTWIGVSDRVIERASFFFLFSFSLFLTYDVSHASAEQETRLRYVSEVMDNIIFIAAVCYARC